MMNEWSFHHHSLSIVIFDSTFASTGSEGRYSIFVHSASHLFQTSFMNSLRVDASRVQQAHSPFSVTIIVCSVSGKFTRKKLPEWKFDSYENCYHENSTQILFPGKFQSGKWRPHTQFFEFGSIESVTTSTTAQRSAYASSNQTVLGAVSSKNKRLKVFFWNSSRFQCVTSLTPLKKFIHMASYNSSMLAEKLKEKKRCFNLR